MWFRVELNKDGSVLKAEHVESKLPGAGRFVVYVDAETKEAAMASAVGRYQHYLEKQRGSKQALRSVRLGAGLCTECGAPGNGKRRCVACSKRLALYRRGDLPEGAKQGRVTEHVKELRLQQAGRSQRAAILAEVLEAAVSMRAGVAFISWLRAERDAAANEKAVAAE